MPLYLSTGHTECKLQFGILEWALGTPDPEPGPLRVEFRPGAEIQLNACHFPFQGWWNATPDMAVEDYFTSLDKDVSDETYAWAKATEPLPARKSALVKNIVVEEKNPSRPETTMSNSTKRPVVLTETWLSYAGHMKRRLTECHSVGEFFEEDCVRNLKLRNGRQPPVDDVYSLYAREHGRVRLPQWLPSPKTASTDINRSQGMSDDDHQV